MRKTIDNTYRRVYIVKLLNIDRLKVLRPKPGPAGQVSPPLLNLAGAAKASNLRKFSPRKSCFSPIRESYLPRKFPGYYRLVYTDAVANE